MFCGNCGNALDSSMTFCSKCGAPVQKNNMNNNMNTVGQQPINQTVAQPVPVNPQPVQQPMNVNYNQNGTINNAITNNNNNNKIIVLACIAIILLLLVFIVLVVRGNGKDEKGVEASARTILVYLCGSDLEEKLALASNDLAGVDSSKVDLSTTNVVVYTGGATKWHNYISPTENAIYVLTENGFEKKETYAKASMGNSASLLQLLNYGYENYKADKYDLVMWNHGLGALGISADTNFGNDYLSLNEISTALQQSNFGGNVKFETVLFRSCLNGNLEIATVFVPYANYLVASEEITWGGIESNILGFINDVELGDSGEVVGKNFIKYYKDTLENLSSKYFGSTLDREFPGSTYSILDLTKVNELQKRLGFFVGDINLNLNYNSVAKARSNVKQYGQDVVEYDTVDLHGLVTELKSLSPGKAQNVLDALDDVVVYNWTNTNYSKGLAIYFPYNGSERYRTFHKSNYKNLKELGDYYNFIYDFSSLQKKASSGGFSAISKDNIDLKVNNKKAILTLNDSNVDNFAKVSYTILEKVNNSRFNVLYQSKTIELSKNTLEVDLNVKLVKVNNSYITLEEVDNGMYTTKVNVVKDDKTINGKLYLNIDNGVKATKIVPISEELSTGYALIAKDYPNINYMKTGYNIYDAKGIEINNWDNNPIVTSITGSNTGYSIGAVTGDYYVVFKIYDVDNLYTYSKVTKIN